MKRNLYIGSVLLIILLLLETIIIKTILKYEFSVNAIELSLKKIYGYSLFNRHKKIFLTTSILGFICIVSASILYYLLKITLFRNVITGGIMIVVMEVEIIISYVNKLERFNVQKILKGGQI